MTPKRDAVLHSVAVSLLSAYPLSLMLRANLGLVPVPFSAIVTVLIAAVASALVLFLALRVVTGNIASRAAWLSVFLLLMGIYAAIVQQLSAMGWSIRPHWPRVGLAYTGLSAAIATIVVRPRKPRKRDPIPMLIIGLVLFGTNTVIGVSRAFPSRFGLTGTSGDWRPAASGFIANAAQRAVRSSPPERDVYYIVLDGFGGTDTMKRLYDLDLTPFVTYLEGKGFRVVPGARSNYVHTYLSLASTLNLDYLDVIATAMGTGSSNRVPLAHLIDRNALMTLAKRAGYHVVGISSDYGATEQLSIADSCVCDQHGSGSTMQAILAATPMLTNFLGTRFVDAHRRKVLDSFDAIERAQSDDRRLFVFAHVLAPHPPFVFEPNGTRPEILKSIMFQDGNAFGGTRLEYRDGYRRQVQFLTRHLTALVDLLLSRSGPRPVIIVHGDHGSGMMLDFNSAEKTDMAERINIFAAYLLPSATRQPHPGMTPLNGTRLLANEYFGTDFPLLGDQTYFSTWDRPYKFAPVSSGSPVDARTDP